MTGKYIQTQGKAYQTLYSDYQLVLFEKEYPRCLRRGSFDYYNHAMTQFAANTALLVLFALAGTYLVSSRKASWELTHLRAGISRDR